MNLFQSLINNPQMSYDPLSFIGTIFTVLVSFYIFKSDYPFSYFQERHEKLIFPLFNLLEPFLYHGYDVDLISKACNIIKGNKALADGKLLSLLYFCTKNPSKDNFIELCSYIDRAYDKSCKRLKLKRRSFSYRISRHQYKSKAYFALFLLMHTIIFCIAMFFGVIIIGSIFILFGAIFSAANTSTQVLMLLVAAVTALAIIKYIERN